MDEDARHDDGPEAAALPFLSDGWLERARLLHDPLPTRPGLGWRLQFDAVDDTAARHRWHQVVEDGRVVAWNLGEVDDADLELRWHHADARALYRGELSGTEALGALSVVVPGGTEGPAPPLDLRDTAELTQMPVLPGATLTVQYEFSDGPFGAVSYWHAFVDGRSSDMDFGRANEPEVRVWTSYQHMVAVRTDAMTILEALEQGGKVEGDIGPLMLMAGLQESDGLHGAELACGPAGAVLARVGEVASSAEYEAARVALALVTA